MQWFPVAILLIVLSSICCAQQPWQPDEFPIGYWYGPPSDFNSLETWQTVKDCNFTFCGPRGGYTTEQNRQKLDFCEQVGIRALIVDDRIHWTMVANDNWREVIAGVVADYASHPALYGYYLQDEPSYRLFESLGVLSRELEKQDPAHLPYINLFPTYANTQQLGTPTYADHLDKYLSIATPRVLSYDHYCLLKNGSIRPDYFENLSLIREYGQKYGVPPWNIILSLSHLSYRDPTEGEMRWQVYTSLAYGMKGIMYFTYWTDQTWVDRGEIGIVGPDGKPQRLYPIVKEVNGEMRALGNTLLGLTSTAIYHTGEEIPPGCTRLGTESVLALPQNLPLIVGYFTDAQGADYAMVVNNDYANAVEFEVAALPHVVAIDEVSSVDGSQAPIAVDEGKFTLSLQPGGGKLLRLETKFDYPMPVKPSEEINFQFDTPADQEGWEGLNSITSPAVADGLFSAGIGPDDPYIVRTFLRIAPDRYTKLKFRMRLDSGNNQAQIFWTTTEEPNFRDDKHLTFPIQADGEWHEYEVAIGEHEKWKGQEIRALRLDPTTGGSEDGARVRIDWIVGE